MTVSIGLILTGSDEEPRWASRVTRSDLHPHARGAGRDCCAGGHDEPEEAAAHGALLAAAWLGRDARSLQPPAIGALALAKRTA